jgi:3-phosphoshikimate 1-carboxyvinyltransferase
VHFVVEPSALQSGSVAVPGDKSISHRALMLGAVADGTTDIRGFLAGEDCLATLAAIRAMGVTVDDVGETGLRVHGAGRNGLKAPAEALDLGNSGTAMRLMAGLLSGQRFRSTLTGDASLCGRPMDRIIRPLAMMGARIDARDGKPPLDIDGHSPLSGIVYRLPVASAQVKSAILLAGLYADGDIAIVEPAVTRDHTERMLRAMGAELNQGETQIMMRGGQQLTGATIDVPADLSSAAFVLLAALLSPDASITVPGVGVNPTRTGVIDILKDMGANISVENVRLAGDEPVADITASASRLSGIDVDPARVSLAIDEFPLLFVAAAAADGKTTFRGIGELRVKESDRIASMVEGLKALSVPVDESEDGAVVHGGKIYGGTVQSHGDHRVAMAFAVAGTIAEWAVRVQDVSSVNTSFPGFADCLSTVGTNVVVEGGSSDS